MIDSTQLLVFVFFFFGTSTFMMYTRYLSTGCFLRVHMSVKRHPCAGRNLSFRKGKHGVNVLATNKPYFNLTLFCKAKTFHSTKVPLKAHEKHTMV